MLWDRFRFKTLYTEQRMSFCKVLSLSSPIKIVKMMYEIIFPFRCTYRGSIWYFFLIQHPFRCRYHMYFAHTESTQWIAPRCRPHWLDVWLHMLQPSTGWYRAKSERAWASAHGHGQRLCFHEESFWSFPTHRLQESWAQKNHIGMPSRLW